MSPTRKRPIEIAGETLYGPAWQSPLAADLGVSTKAVWRWKEGVHAVPDGVWDDIIAIAKRRQGEMKDIAAYARMQKAT